jgi:hypothetical protein
VGFFVFGGATSAAKDTRTSEQKDMRMNTWNHGPAARPDSAERFARAPEPPAPFRGVGEDDLERLKHRLLRAQLDTVATPSLLPLLRRAANEAAALAWLEPDPLLVFPLLLEEKAAAARRRHHKQGLVRSRSEAIVEVAA